MLLPIYQTPDTSPDDVSRVPSQQQFPLATLREILGGFLPREVPEPVSLTYAEQTLLQPAIDPTKLISSPFETDWTPAEKEGVALLGAIKNERDPRFIPLLVKLMHGGSRWLKSQEGYGAISHYWQMFPHAFKSELDKQGLTAPALAKALEQGFPGSPNRLLDRPNAVWSLTRDGNLGLPRNSLDDDHTLLAKRYASSPELRRVLTDYCKMTFALEYRSPDINALHMLWLADPAAARPLIERVRVQQEAKLAAERAEELANPGKPASQWPFAASQSRFRFLALAVTAGHTEFVDELLSNFPISPREPRNNQNPYPQWHDVQVLLWPNNPRVLERYLQITDAELANSFSDLPAFTPFGLPMNYEAPSPMVQALFIHHPREFADRTLRLLRSSLPALRSAGKSLLENVFYWNMGYEPRALTRERTLELKTVTTLLQRFSGMSEEPMRLTLLKHLGINVPANSTQSLTVLRQLISDPNPAIARNALRLLELRTGDYYVDYLWNFPSAGQERLWNDLITDHKLVLQDMPTPIREEGGPL
ncbi:hypothetical protein EON80_21845 [bacterium]|nr:MAG: hypothetical protein EON80_21845 [bacterium]